MKRVIAGLIVILIVFAFAATLKAQYIQYVGNYNTPDFARDIFMVNNYAYVVDYRSGFQVIDISDPTNPEYIGSYNALYYALNVFVLGNYAYVTDIYYGFYIVDVANPDNPVLTGSYYGGVFPTDVSVLGHFAYVTDYHNRLIVINVADPTNPVKISGCDWPMGPTFGIFVKDNYAYIASGYGGLRIINIDVSGDPIVTGNYDTPDFASKVFVQGNYAYVADNDSGLEIINVADPANPILVGNYNTPSYAQGVFVEGDYAYLADCYSGLQIINIANPANPLFVASYNTPGPAFDVFVRDNYIYLADSSSFMILKFDPTGIENTTELPNNISLSQNYPNPFNAQTKIAYSLTQRGNVLIDIYDILGQRINQLSKGAQEPGNHEITWDATGIPTGVYFYRLTAGDYQKTKRMLLLK